MSVLEIKKIALPFLAVIYCIPFASLQSAVTTCDDITDVVAKARCEFVKNQSGRSLQKPMPPPPVYGNLSGTRPGVSVIGNATPAACLAIQDDRQTNRQSKYLSDVAACINRELIVRMEDRRPLVLTRNYNEVTYDSNGVPIANFLVPTEAYGSCSWMMAQGFALVNPCDPADPRPIKTTIPTKEDQPALFLLAPNSKYEFSRVYSVYAGSWEKDGLVQNVSFYDNESTSCALTGLSLLDDKVLAQDAINEITDTTLTGKGGYAETFLREKPPGSTVVENPSIFLDRSNRDAIVKIGDPSGEEVLANYLGLGGRTIDYGVVTFGLRYENTYRSMAQGNASISDSGIFECGGSVPPPPPPPRCDGLVPNQPAGAPNCGKFEPIGAGTQISLSTNEVTTTIVSNGITQVICLYNEYTRVTRYPYQVNFPCKTVNVNLVNIF